jgi:hypothetical protein
MANRRDVLKGIGIGATLPAIPLSCEAKAGPTKVPVERTREVLVTRVRIGLLGSVPSRSPDDEDHYWAEAFEDDGKFYYRAKGVTIETSEDRYRSVIVNPYLYYFSSALWLHYQILGALKKNEGIA